MKKETKYALLGVAIFAIGFGCVEAAIVKYLRVIFYDGGFSFPLQGFVDPAILGVEWVREFFTLVMLAGVGIAVGRTAYEKFAYFLYSFAIWDIFYYVWLKIFLGWPESLLTWDILFLIPWPWLGPVLAPVLYSLVMLTLALIIIYHTDKKRKIFLTKKEWTLFLIGSAIVLFTFIIDYAVLIFSNGFAGDFFILAENEAFNAISSAYVPSRFLWEVFLPGIICMVYSIILLCKRMGRKERH